jgi:hypothetical protein
MGASWHLNDDTIGSTEPWAPWCRRTRNAPLEITGNATTESIANYAPAEKLASTAMHEAAHVVLYLATGHGIREIVIDASSDADSWISYEPYSGGWLDFAVSAAAGERAQDRWLRETGLWTPGRAWVAERYSWRDRRLVSVVVSQAHNEELTFGLVNHWSDYAWIGDRAAEALDPVWDQVLTLARHLANHRHITGEQAARVAGLTFATPGSTGDGEGRG